MLHAFAAARVGRAGQGEAAGAADWMDPQAGRVAGGTVTNVI